MMHRMMVSAIIVGLLAGYATLLYAVVRTIVLSPYDRPYEPLLFAESRDVAAARLGLTAKHGAE
jgi:hypothetical protein